jgi:hypothetical protein
VGTQQRQEQQPVSNYVPLQLSLAHPATTANAVNTTTTSNNTNTTSNKPTYTVASPDSVSLTNQKSTLKPSPSNPKRTFLESILGSTPRTSSNNSNSKKGGEVSPTKGAMTPGRGLLTPIIQVLSSVVGWGAPNQSKVAVE